MKSQNDMLNFNIYRKFWSIQKYLQNPLSIFVDDEPENESNWILFKDEDKETLMEIEEISNDKENNVNNNGNGINKTKKTEEKKIINAKNLRFNKFFENIFNILEIFSSNPIITIEENQTISLKNFPRFLTNSCLLDTQFRDLNFRKVWLTQLLLALYSLKNPIKITPQKNFILLAEQVLIF